MSTIIEAVGLVIGGALTSLGASAATVAAATTTAGTISTVLTVGSALSSIGQGIAASNSLKMQSQEAALNSELNRKAGAQKSLDLAREYKKLQSEAVVTQLANGLDVGVGTAVDIRAATSREASRRLDISRQNARGRVRMARLRSRGLLSEANAAFTGGIVNAGGKLLDNQQLVGG